MAAPPAVPQKRSKAGTPLSFHRFRNTGVSLRSNLAASASIQSRPWATRSSSWPAGWHMRVGCARGGGTAQAEWEARLPPLLATPAFPPRCEASP